MNKEVIILQAKDCCEFDNQEGHSEVFQYLLSKQELQSVFKFNQDNNSAQDDSPIVVFDYNTTKWRAGRYVGETTFTFEGKSYKIVIAPRFGELQLYTMLEEVFNIRLSQSSAIDKNQTNYQLLIKRILAYIWSNLLGKANKHGIPKKVVKKEFKGTKIRGRLSVRESILSVHTENKLVSIYSEKVPEEVILRILKQAHNLLIKEYDFGTIRLSSATRNALQQLFSTKIPSKRVTELEYLKIHYKPIFLNYKPLVDLSWDIIKNKSFGRNRSVRNTSQSFFIDMAEIWEMYLRSLLKKHLIPKGWKLTNEKLVAYKSKSFQRRLIPDIVFEKNGEFLVWDAKYKQMKYKYYDYDRSDFFQIHTYINYFASKGNVRIAGLLYPLSEPFTKDIQNQNYSQNLFGLTGNNCAYHIDGIDYSLLHQTSQEQSRLLIKDEISTFLFRINNLLKI